MSWTEGETRTYTFEGASEDDSKYTETLDAGTYEIEVHGADGGDAEGDFYSCAEGSGGTGGYIKGDFTASSGDSLEIWVGQEAVGYDGDNFGVGGWGRSDGGDSQDNTNSGGAGAGSTEILINSNFLAAADGGGGGGHVEGNPDGCSNSQGGGGGARGGSGGSGDDDGNDAEGTGFGGDGGDADLSTETAEDGEDGGQEAGSDLTVLEQQEGGATEDEDGHGYVKITYLGDTTDDFEVGETRIYEFKGASEEDSKYVEELPAGTYEVEVHGADGGYETTNNNYGGTAGYIKGVFGANSEDVLELWIGQSGDVLSAGDASAWGRHKGGKGYNPDGRGAFGGYGGASTELLLNSQVLAIAGGGGGASHVSDNLYAEGVAAGGGGAPCGLGGAATTDDSSYPTADGEDAECLTGFEVGGDGADASREDGESFSEDGEDGGQIAGSLLSVEEETTGGATSDEDGHGYVVLERVSDELPAELGSVKRTVLGVRQTDENAVILTQE